MLQRADSSQRAATAQECLEAFEETAKEQKLQRKRRHGKQGTAWIHLEENPKRIRGV